MCAYVSRSVIPDWAETSDGGLDVTVVILNNTRSPYITVDISRLGGLPFWNEVTENNTHAHMSLTRNSLSETEVLVIAGSYGG